MDSLTRGQVTQVDPERLSAYGRKADREFVAAALVAADPEGSGRLPVVAGTAPKGRAALKVAGVSRATNQALKAAGYRDRHQLAHLRLGQLGGAARGITLRDVDRLHEEHLLASYARLGVPREQAGILASHRIHPTYAAFYLPVCGGNVIVPGDGFQGLDVLDVLRDRELFDELIVVDLGGPIPDPEPPIGWLPGGGVTDPPDPGIDLLNVATLKRVVVDDALVSRFVREGVEPAEVGPAVHSAQVLLSQGRRDDALGVLHQVGTVERDGLASTARYQMEVLAPALVALHGADAGARAPQQRVHAARTALRRAVPGSRTHTALVRSLVAEQRLAGDAHLRRSQTANGPARERERHAARQAYLGALTGGTPAKSGDAPGDPLIALQGAAPLLDLYRSVGVAVAAPAEPTVLKAGDQQRLLPAQGYAHLLGAGGVAALSDDVVKGHALHAWKQLHRLTCDGTAYVPQVLPGDLFRFDWLLDEARQLADDVARIEELLTSFLNLVMQQALDKIGSVTGIVEELARLVDNLVKRVQAVAAEVPAIVRDLAEKAQTAALMVGLVRWLRDWPHDRWIRVVEAIIDAVATGDNVIDRVMDAIIGPLEADIAQILTDAQSQIEGTLTRLQEQVDGLALPDELLASFHDALAAAGVSDPSAEILAPLEEALENLDLMAIARDALDDLGAVVGVPDWLKAILAVWVLAPVVGAVVALLASGPIGWVLLWVGMDYLVSLAVRALTDVLGLATDLQNQVDEAIARLNELIGGLVTALADVGALQGMISGVDAILDAVEELLPEEVRDAVHGALATARDTVLDNVHGITVALERAYFRETLDLVQAAPSEGFATELPRDGQMLGFNDPRYGSSAVVAQVLSTYELERVRRTTSPLQELTQVISLRHVLGSAAALQPLLAGLPLNFAITQTFLDRLIPGLEEALIEDVQLHLDFDVPPEVQTALDTVLSTASTIAGGGIDPALDGRVSGGGFPGLPVVVGRVPSGIPAVLTHRGTSYVRLRPGPELANAYTDECGCPADPLKLAPPIRGTRLLDDPDPEAHEAGWRRLMLLDRPAQQVFSHFDVLDDTVRFHVADKELQPFEHRGMVGSWMLEVPALRLGSVVHQLPPLRDVRLVVSGTARYSTQLADLVAQPPVPVTEPDVTAAADGLLPDVGLPADVTAILAKLDEVKGAIDGVVGDLATAITGDLDDLTAALGTNITGFTDAADRMTTTVAAALGNLLAVADGLVGQIAVVQLSTETLANATDVLTGAAAATWSSTDITAAMAEQGIAVSSVSRVVQVVVVPVLSSSLLGGAVTWPNSAGELAFTPSGGATEAAPITFDGGTVLVDGGDLGSPTSPAGTWELTLPSGMPALDRVLIGLVVETFTP
ncbi:MAG: hypothetical protein KY462_14815 [Actinobacteria bacterium]|nr:hypothetical protein [Actinomycetota bacterium]